MLEKVRSNNNCHSSSPCCCVRSNANFSSVTAAPIKTRVWLYVSVRSKFESGGASTHHCPSWAAAHLPSAWHHHQKISLSSLSKGKKKHEGRLVVNSLHSDIVCFIQKEIKSDTLELQEERVWLILRNRKEKGKRKK